MFKGVKKPSALRVCMPKFDVMLDDILLEAVEVSMVLDMVMGGLHEMIK